MAKRGPAVQPYPAATDPRSAWLKLPLKQFYNNMTSNPAQPKGNSALDLDEELFREMLMKEKAKELEEKLNEGVRGRVRVNMAPGLPPSKIEELHKALDGIVQEKRE